LFEYSEKASESALFIRDYGTPLARCQFFSKLKESLLNAGYNPSKFSGHSFCHGTASSAMAIGLNGHEIQQLGTWRSDSYKLYINNLQAQLLSFSSCLHGAIPPSQIYEPPSHHFPSSVA